MVKNESSFHNPWLFLAIVCISKINHKTKSEISPPCPKLLLIQCAINYNKSCIQINKTGGFYHEMSKFYSAVHSFCNYRTI